MYNDLNEDLWETLLKAAVIKNSINDLEGYPSTDEINKIVITNRYDMKMRKLIKRINYQLKTASLFAFIRKIATIIIIILGISFTFLFQFKEVRAACQNVIISIYEKFIQFDYYQDENKTNSDINVEYLPKGFYEIEVTKNKLKSSIKYGHANGKTILLQYSSNAQALQIDNEHYNIKQLNINGVTGNLFESQDINFQNYIIWSKDKNNFILISSIDIEEMKKIAENIK